MLSNSSLLGGVQCKITSSIEYTKSKKVHVDWCFSEKKKSSWVPYSLHMGPALVTFDSLA